jgi:hypothetical protein
MVLLIIEKNMLSINNYLRELLVDPQSLYTPGELVIPHDLCTLFYSLRRVADINVREYGRSLQWHSQNNVGRIVPGPANFIGPPSGTSVDLQIATERQHQDYVGDFHVHPYEQKYGAGIAIAPSHGDWDVWWVNRPAHRGSAVHFVASGNDLFLVVFRQPTPDPLSYIGVSADAVRLNEAVAEWNIQDADRYGGHLANRRWLQSQQLLKRLSPGAISMHRADAHQMNIQFSNANKCEYFSGRLRNGPSTLTLHSKRVLGNILTTKLWTRSTSPWF